MSVVSLVPHSVSQETVDLFDALADAARRGDINGAAVSFTYPGPERHFGLCIAGAARRDPTHASGSLNKFIIELSNMPK